MAGRALVVALKFVCKKIPETLPGSAAIVWRHEGAKPGRLQDRERYETGDKDKKFCKWNTNFHWDVLTGKTGLPSEQFHFFWEFSSRANRKNVFPLAPKRKFRNQFLTKWKAPKSCTNFNREIIFVGGLFYLFSYF